MLAPKQKQKETTTKEKKHCNFNPWWSSNVSSTEAIFFCQDLSDKYYDIAFKFSYN